MDALKQIPQAFFEFFARLVPGFVVLTLWMTLFDGMGQWQAALKSLTADLLSEANIVSVILIVGLFACYAAGQLIAPFGKAMQRITEAVVNPKKAVEKIAGLFPNANDSGEVPPGDYDWLRARAPELGSFVAKIRAEYTMFYAVAAIFFASILLRWQMTQPVNGREIIVLALLGVACAWRGYTVTSTCKETAKKLRAAFP